MSVDSPSDQPISRPPWDEFLPRAEHQASAERSWRTSCSDYCLFALDADRPLLDIPCKDWDYDERVLHALRKHRFPEREHLLWKLGNSDRQFLETLLSRPFPRVTSRTLRSPTPPGTLWTAHMV